MPTTPTSPPLPWRPHSEMRSATRSEIARVPGILEVMVYDLPANTDSPRIIGWEIHDGPEYLTAVDIRRGFPDYDAAKADATRAALALIEMRR